MPRIACCTVRLNVSHSFPFQYALPSALDVSLRSRVLDFGWLSDVRNLSINLESTSVVSNVTSLESVLLAQAEGGVHHATVMYFENMTSSIVGFVLRSVHTSFVVVVEHGKMVFL